MGSVSRGVRLASVDRSRRVRRTLCMKHMLGLGRRGGLCLAAVLARERLNRGCAPWLILDAAKFMSVPFALMESTFDQNAHNS